MIDTIAREDALNYKLVSSSLLHDYWLERNNELVANCLFLSVCLCVCLSSSPSCTYHLAPSTRMSPNHEQQSGTEFWKLPPERRGLFDAESDLLLGDCPEDALVAPPSHEQARESEEKVSFLLLSSSILLQKSMFLWKKEYFFRSATF